MGIAEDLLVVADRLANPVGSDPVQASLRRSVSTAYYALFHLLIGEAAQLWVGGSSASRLRLEREFDHGLMKEVSRSFSEAEWTNWSDQTVRVPSDLQLVAETFVLLQQLRHAADYDNVREWTPSEAQTIVALVRQAFQQWQAVRTEPIAQDYLLSFLVGKKRR